MVISVRSIIKILFFAKAEPRGMVFVVDQEYF